MEVVLRRAGDLAFLFQNYEFAYANYYAAKRDLSREQAPTFYAAVLVRSDLLLSINPFSLICLGNVLSSQFYAGDSGIESLSFSVYGRSN